MKPLPFPRCVAELGAILLLLMAGSVAAQPLVLVETPGVITVSFAGRAPVHNPGTGIPSWKAILRQDDGGNLSALHIPADSPKDVSSRRGGWPITILATRSQAGVDEPNKGRENYASFPVETMEVVSQSPDTIVIRVAGPSRQRHFEHERTYTFTPAGVAIAGELTALVDLLRVSWDPHWDRDQIADSHQAAVPLRTQGGHGWISAYSTGSDSFMPLPEGVDFPLEAELSLRRPEPTFIRIFIDQNFATNHGRRRFVNNNKDFHSTWHHRTFYERLVGGIAGGPLAVGEHDSFKVRYTFETRPLITP